MIVYVNPEISGNVFVRVAPNTGAPSCGTPAYNSKNIGILYDIDDQHRDENTGEIWYHIRGLGWSMARYMLTYNPETEPEQDKTKRWLVGLTREEVEECIEYLRKSLEGGVD